ncbi:MAG: glycine C-acetyltransferase [Armatimonadota bacterium]|nr:glycine C-acetyltransferase [Armatimonadota bacterium]MDR7447844.1 glycine C-acetyltransferase [Armatimonadota bacterium]MDR7459862.1 glycine C-acetyltransferase [Armatimonadota bacterium]MDR7479807.1 glycine C-acetyltransferase [Armatimonadota bacterium]MDR7487530.1 glycine C-acetyltransferase [Armatimonadota bacterium]
MATQVTNPLAFLDDELEALRRQGLFRWPRVLSGPQEPVATYDGRQVINLCSNNYLALANHPRLKAAAVRAVEALGVGPGAVRTIAGNLEIHRLLEAELAAFKHTEATLLYQSGFTANAGTVAALLGREDVIVSDELNHASIIDGARLSGATKKIYPHGDVEAARRLLAESRGARRVLLITDGVFSMDGDIAPLPALVEAAEAHGAIMMVDDAHASGVVGRQGRGTVDHFGLHGRVHIQVGTLSKAFGGLGGYVAGSRALIDFLVHRARPLLFSTSHPPAVAAAALEAVRYVQEPEGEERIARLWEHTRLFKEGLRQLGFDTGRSETPITPILVGEETLAMRLSDRLFELGVFALGIAYPTVPRGKARVRTIVTAGHTPELLRRALDAFERAGRELGLI